LWVLRGAGRLVQLGDRRRFAMMIALQSVLDAEMLE
jgi:hypothetical protein